jgi:hypothetical protein
MTSAQASMAALAIRSISDNLILIPSRARADVATFLPPSRTSRTSHDGPMEREHAETSLRRRGVQGALANERAADSRARALAASLRKLIAAGFVSQPALAKELNRRKVPTTHGGKWHRTTVARVLARLGVSTNGNINNGLWHKQAADVRAKAMASTIRKLRRARFVSANAIAAKLNEQGMAASRGGRWHFSTVTRLLERLDRLDRASRGQHRR